MLQLAPETIAGQMRLVAWLGSFGILISFFASRYGFFRLKEKPRHVLISTASLIELFGLFIVISMFGPLILRNLIASIGKVMGVGGGEWRFYLMTMIQIASEILLLFLISLYAFAHKRIDMAKIFKTGKEPLWKDLGIGVLAWIISFPVVGAVDGLMETLTISVFGSVGPPQIAVQFIKALAKSSYLWLGVFITVFMAPLIEEFIFRGCIQTYLRNRVSRMSAIVTSSIIFAIVHFAPSQGIGNLPLLVSIFVFGLYLGFVYERQGSLFASFALHATFNALSLVRILYVS